MPAPETIIEPPTPVQLPLPGAQELFAAAGLETLPHGVGDLTARQLKFAIAYLENGCLKDAAVAAGYSPESAEKVRKTPAMQRFLNASVKTVAENGDALVRRKWELSVAYHAELKRLREKPLAERTEKELRRENQVALMAVRNDLLLASLLNRLGVKLTGEVQVNHNIGGGGDFIVVPPDALAGFARARQEAVAGGRN